MKKRLNILFVALAMMASTCITASAAGETVTGAGFYDIGQATQDDSVIESVTVTPVASSGTVNKVSANVDSDGEYEEFYANSDKLSVNYTAAKVGGRYGWILVQGTGLPTVDDEIHYINQETVTTSSVTFDVYPILPEKTTALTLYISSDEEELISIPLNYAISGTYDVKSDDEPTYTLGDVVVDGRIDSTDALRTLRIAAKLHTPTEAEKLAANVNVDGSIDSTDALRILRYAAKLITSWN